jgi:hypothetical protein
MAAVTPEHERLRNFAVLKVPCPFCKAGQDETCHTQYEPRTTYISEWGYLHKQRQDVVRSIEQGKVLTFVST